MERREFLSRLGGDARTAWGVPATIAVVEERDPAAFRAAFVAAVAGGGQVALANPDWGREERTQFAQLLAQTDPQVSAERGWLLVPTGGSSGGVKLARHDQTTLAAAVRGYVDFFGEPVVSGVGVLPLHHVGGLLAWLRCALTGGTYREAPWRAWSEGDWTGSETWPADATVSLVPTQLRRLLELPGGAAMLRRFQRVLIGGGATDQALVRAAENAGVRVALSYAMTETAALAAVQTGSQPEGFAMLPHLHARLAETERVVLAGASLFCGYWPSWREPGEWVTADRGRWDAANRLHILGRSDDTIISGGEKVDAHEVETTLRTLLADERVVVLGVPDARWGQRVVACVGDGLAERLAQQEAVIRERLARFKMPKQIVTVTPWPVSAMGKVNRATLRAAVENARMSEGV